MAEEKLNADPEAQKAEEAPALAVADPAHGEPAVAAHRPKQAGPAGSGDVTLSAEQIDASMAENRRAAQAEVEGVEASRGQKTGAAAPDRPATESDEAEKPSWGLPSRPDKAKRIGPETEKEPKKAGGYVFCWK